MAKKKPLNRQQREELINFWRECKPLNPNNDLFQYHHWEDKSRLRTVPDNHEVDIGSRTIELQGYAVMQLHDKNGNVTDLAHFDADKYAFEPTATRLVYTPTGYPRGYAHFGDVDNEQCPVVLCRSIGEAFAIMQFTNHPALFVVYFEKSNLKYAIKDYKGRPLAMASFDNLDEWLARTDYPREWVTQIATGADPITSLGFTDGFYVDLIGNKFNEWLAKKQPHTPQNNSKAKGTHQTSLTKGFGKWTFDAMVEHLYLVYGTDTVWDNLNEKRMRIGNLRHSVGNNEMFKLWQEAEDRKTVMDLVFEPSGNLPPNSINLFKGLPTQPYHPPEKCQKILQHIKLLCANRETEYHWLLRWLAYPLQNLGAKMDTAVIMYGSEGPGKSILFEQIMGKIYSVGNEGHLKTVNQPMLEDKFNSWLSRKLFILCEEVVSRSERNHLKGQLKHLVTGKTYTINEKNLPTYEETNHANFVFLSNSTIPLELDIGDRRYFVCRVDKVPDKKYFDDLFVEIDGDGVAAFYHYLVNMDLGEFNPHTKPPANEDKQKLINASLPNPVLFYNEWQAGDVTDNGVTIPYGCCLKIQLFQLYKRWCHQRNEYPKRDRDFNAEIDRYMKDARKDISFPSPTSTKKTTRLWITKEAQKLFDYKDPMAISNVEGQTSKFNNAVELARKRAYV